MAKGAAREAKLGKLHSTLTQVFIRVLDRYLEQMEPVSDGQIEDEVVDEVLELFEPNPAMLSAISKFLKDNEIMYDSEELDQLSATQRRLQEMKKKRGNVVTLDNLPLAEEG
jgi:hypothetical protein